MRGIVLECGDPQHVPPTLDAEYVPARPGKTDIDHLLADTTHVTVAGDDADLAAVVLRLLRRELLGAVSVAYLPPPGSAVAALWGLPTEPVPALELAASGAPAPVPLLRDDAGGVLVGRGVLDAVDGVGYCDDELALRGAARRIEVQPDPAAGLVVRVTRGRLGPMGRRVSTLRGRAFQFGGGGPMHPVLDGARRERPANRWTWYRHTEDLLLVR